MHEVRYPKRICLSPLGKRAKDPELSASVEGAEWIPKTRPLIQGSTGRVQGAS